MSPFCPRGPHAAQLAGVLLGVRVQREHRRVEHRVGQQLVLGMRRFRLGRRATAGGTRSGGVADAARAVVRADVWARARRRVGARMRGRPRV